MKKLEPVLLNEKLIEELAEEILGYYRGEIYQPIADVLKIKLTIVENSAEDDIIRALRQEKITVDTDNNEIRGKFDAKLSKAIIKAGGKYNKVKKSYLFDRLPFNIINYLQRENSIANESINKVLTVMRAIGVAIITLNNYNISFGNIIGDINQQLKSNMMSTNQGILVRELKQVQFTEQEKQNINNNYINNLKLSIKDWEDKNIVKMRTDLTEMLTKQDKTNGNIIDYIQKEYNTTANKAVFLARQETNLLLTEYASNKYKQMGIKYFQWETREDDRVRNSHRVLNKKTFSFDDPPKNTKGENILPGQEYGCRCVMIPVIKTND
jgi:SPP1 gp7 family putative phage head morphogenesis protein